MKAANHDGEMFIIEEVQLFEPPEPIKILKFSNVTVRPRRSINDSVITFKPRFKMCPLIA